VSSGVQPGTASSTPINTLGLGLLGVAPSFLVYGELAKDGRKMIMKLGKDGDAVTTLLRGKVGSLVTTQVPTLGIAWTSTLSYRRGAGYLYVRVPSNLKAVLEPIWRAGVAIPIIITIPPIPTPNK